jgi:isopentenyldiphosphate isomerase
MTSEIELYKERVKIFDLKGKFLGIQNRKKFYKEIRKEYQKTKKVTRQVHTIRVFLMNSKGGIYLTKRSGLKKENKHLYDKTIGGHIRGDESPEYTLLRECAEELGFPAAGLSDEEFGTAISETDLQINGVFKKIETINNFQANYRYTDGSFVIFPQITTIFIGFFDGHLNFKDGETSGIEIYYTDEISEELKNNPSKYSQDVKELLPKYLPEMKKLIKQVKSYQS